MIIDHNRNEYQRIWKEMNPNRYNGAYYYSKEIVRNIIPEIETDRNWITVNVPGIGASHSIVFIHNNLHPENYNWLKAFSDLVLVCGVPSTCSNVSHLGRAIYLPLSIDTEEVQKYRQEKTREVCFAGRKTKRSGFAFPSGTDYIEGYDRAKLLTLLGKYKKVYAVGRTAIEARALGCEILPYDPRFPDPSIWKVIDNKDAALMLQEELDKIDKKGKGEE